ncbi:MAG: hypothetical protein OXI51_14130 [Chloroflexota bacterium]|nr:hypothetical protein [Chloroflexota bacterium]
MVRETVTLALNSGTDVSVGDFARAVHHFDRLLTALSRAHSGKDAQPIEWQLERLATGSAILTAATDHPRAGAVVDGYLRVGRALTDGEPLPYGRRVHDPAEDLLKMLSAGVHEIRFETREDEAVLRSSTEREPIAVPLAVSVGAVEGTVEVLSSRRGLRFNLYDSLFDRAVSCYVRSDAGDLLRDIWGKRVVVEGRVSRDPAGRPVAVREISEVTVVDPPVPGGWRRARGAIPARPGSPRPEEILRRVRDAT